jgi:NAD(P)-dependent dehydrogenase (short-subunit alcohol dehydrogenase family)
MGSSRPEAPQFATSTVLITGGTSGVGRAAAVKFAAAGVRRIAIVGRNAERGEKARADIAALSPGAEIMYLSADANKAADAVAICDQVAARFGSIDILLNSTVGPDAPALLKNTPIEALEGMLVQQAIGPLLMSRAVLPFMVARKAGVILNIASDAAKVATPGEAVLGAAMAAIVMFSRALAIEAKRDGIRVNALTPSLIGGTMTTARMQENPFAAKLFEKAATMAHLGVADADDLADLAVFLASPAAGRITGQAISANGGISAA